MPSKRIFTIFFAFVCLISCKTSYQPQSVKYEDYKVNQSYRQDSALAQLLHPYADSVNKSMKAIVAVAAINLEKKQPEGTLGNILADAMLSRAKQLYKAPVDAAFVNYGGIRLAAIPAGNITTGKIFELAPFDNIIVLQKITGKVLQQFLNHISARGGWPVSGISWQIKNKLAVKVSVNGSVLDESGVYTIALLDYVANGGDDCAMLKRLPQINNGYLFRDAVIAYFSGLHQSGEQIFSKIENRVSNAE